MMQLAPRVPNYAFYENKARFRYLEGDLPGARTFLEKSLALYPDNNLAWVNLGDVLTRLGLKESAKTALNSALAINPYYRPALKRLGLPKPTLPDHALPRLYPCSDLPCLPVAQSVH